MMIKVDDTTLLTFLLDWQAWAGSKDRKSPCGVAYSLVDGLCGSAWEYVWKVYDKHTFDERSVAESDLRTMLQQRFSADGLSKAWPFGRKRYMLSQADRAMHMCPVRLQWVADTIADLTVPEPASEQDVWRKEYNVTGMLKLIFIVLAAWLIYALSATFAKADDPAYITLTAATCFVPASKIYRDNPLDCTVRVYRLEDNQDMAYCELIRDAITADARSNVSARCDFID